MMPHCGKGMVEGLAIEANGDHGWGGHDGLGAWWRARLLSGDNMMPYRGQGMVESLTVEAGGDGRPELVARRVIQ